MLFLLEKWEITEQDIVDGYAKAIEDAIAGLKKKEINQIENNNVQTKVNKTIVKSVNTGDSTNIIELLGLFMISIMSLVLLRRKEI